MAQQMRRLYIAEMARDAVIEGKTFENMRITGPAILFPHGQFQVFGGGAHGPVEGAVWKMPEAALIQGVIRLSNCVFRHCTFENIGWATGDVERTIDDVGWMYDGDATPPQDWSPPQSEE